MPCLISFDWLLAIRIRVLTSYSTGWYRTLLNGELSFLGVWPFCLSDQTDGFWSHRVGKPWLQKDEEVSSDGLLISSLLQALVP
jgi:hypothetical protein